MPARRRTRRVLASLVAGVCVALGGAVVSVPAAGAGSPPPSVVILDASGSMVRDAAGGGSRMDQARTAATDVLTSLPKDAQVGLLVFGTGTGNDDAERAAGCSDVKTLSPVAAVDAASMRTQIAGIKPSGFTPLGPSLRAAADMLPKDQAANIILITDGVDTCAPPPACEVASQLRSERPSLSIHVIGFSLDKDEQAQGQLQCIGTVGGGSFVTAGDAKQLAARLGAAVTADTASGQLNVLGAHGVALGMTLDQARAKLGDDARITGRETVDGVEVVFVDCSWGRVELRGGVVTGIVPTKADRTAEGIAVGARLADAEAVYGTAVLQGSDEDGDYAVFPIRPGAAPGYRVYADGSGTITRVVLCLCAPLPTAVADLGEWEATFDGIGPVKLGMTMAEVAEVFPDAGPIGPRHPGHPTDWPLVTAADGRTGVFGVSIDDDDMVQRVWTSVVRERSTVDYPSVSLPHANGIRIGESGPTADYAYGGLTLTANRFDTYDRWLITDRDGRMLSFDADRGGRQFDLARAGQGPIVRIAVTDMRDARIY